MAKKYKGDKPAATPKMGEFENFIADQYGAASLACIKHGREIGLDSKQIQQIMLFALRQLGKMAGSIISIYSAQLSRVAQEKIDSRVPVDPKTLKPKKK